MVEIAFILLCHKDPAAIIAQTRRLTETGDGVAIHFDANAPQAAYDEVRTALSGLSQVTFAKRRVRCGWGEWSLVQATLNTIEAALEAFPRASHLYMLSGDCMPIKSARYAHDLLAPADRDFIESVDFFASDWIRTGPKRERLVYRHFVNERQRKWLFYASIQMQRRLGLERKIPEDFEIMIGSQWWCLRRRTVEKIMAFCAERPDIPRFFRHTWIPDETFFQTLVRHLVPSQEIDSRSLTFKMFSDYGMPVTFYNDHYDFLLSQDALFARKISLEATELKARLGTLWDAPDTEFQTSGDGQKLYEFLTGRGRTGRRFAPRFWERAATLGRDRVLVMLVCKKWHVAKRFLGAIVEETGMRGLEYVFDEAACAVPELGGIERTLEKRNRHRRALMRMLFHYYQTDRMAICLDPNNLELLKDFSSDPVETHLIELRCRIDDAYLTGHAERVGLANRQTPSEVMERILPTLHYDFAYESDRIRDAALPGHVRIDEGSDAGEQARHLAEGLGMPLDVAERILNKPHLFAD